MNIEEFVFFPWDPSAHSGILVNRVPFEVSQWGGGGGGQGVWLAAR